MALFEVYVKGPDGRVVGWMTTQSEYEASAEAESLSKEGYEAWYEQIQ